MKAVGPLERRILISKIGEIFADVLADVTAHVGEPKILVKDNNFRSWSRWSAVWFIEGQNNGFSLDLEGGGRILVKSWDVTSSFSALLNDIDQAESHLRRMIPPELLSQISEKEQVEQELRTFLSRAVWSYLLHRTHPDIQHKPGTPGFYRQQGEDAGLTAAQKIIEEERPSP